MEPLDKLITIANKKFGNLLQLTLMNEEASELIKAISKLIRHYLIEGEILAPFLYYRNIVEEIVDVELMLKQLKYIVETKIGKPTFEKEYDFFLNAKIKRFMERINDQKKELEK